MINNIRIAWQLFLQERQLRYQKILFWTNSLLLTFVLSLSVLGDSIQSYLEENLQALLGADLVISQQKELSAEQASKLESMSNEVVATKEAITTLYHRKNWQQIKLRAVDDNYPLHGKLLTSPQNLAARQSQIGEITSHSPSSGEIWFDTRLMKSLAVKIGERINIADRSFLISRSLIHEPDRLMESHNVHMRAMINLSDFDSLKLAQDQISYRYLLDANVEQIKRINTWLSKELPSSKTMHRLGAHPLANFWKRVENVLGLASIIFFLLAAVAIEQLANISKSREIRFAAVCMSMGTAKKEVLSISICKWLFNLGAILPLALLLSYVIHYFVIEWLESIFNGIKPEPKLAAAFPSFLVMASILATFHLPIFLSIIKSSALDLLRQGPSHSNCLAKLCGVFVLVIVIVFYADNHKLATLMAGALCVTVTALLLSAWLSLSIAERLTQKFSSLTALAIFMMRQSLVSKSAQILGIGLSSFLLLFMLVFLQDLQDSFSSYKREHDGNLFISQANAEQMKAIQTWAETHKAEIRQAKPFVFAQLHSINEQMLDKHANQASESLALVKKPIRLHWTKSIPKNNSLVQGTWWPESNQDWRQISVEEEVMSDLNLKLGDSLGFYINNELIEFDVASSHKYVPGSGSVTFWFQMPELAIKQVSADHYYMGSMELKEADWQHIGQLWQQYPTLRMSSLKQLTERFDKLLNIVTQVTSGFSVLIILLAMLVILATALATEDKERKKNGIIMSLGFDRSTCLKLNAIEWAFTALIAGLVAVFGAYMSGVLIYESEFSLKYQADIGTMLGTLCCILLFVQFLGFITSRKSIFTSIKQLLSDT